MENISIGRCVFCTNSIVCFWTAPDGTIMFSVECSCGEITNYILSEVLATLKDAPAVESARNEVRSAFTN